MSEVEYLDSQLNYLKKKIEAEKKAESFKEAAEDLHKICNAFTSAGFTDEQAWWLTGQVFLRAIGANSV